MGKTAGKSMNPEKSNQTKLNKIKTAYDIRSVYNGSVFFRNVRMIPKYSQTNLRVPLIVCI